jgi:hypothetical protein
MSGKKVKIWKEVKKSVISTMIEEIGDESAIGQ